MGKKQPSGSSQVVRPRKAPVENTHSISLPVDHSLKVSAHKEMSLEPFLTPVIKWDIPPMSWDREASAQL